MTKVPLIHFTSRQVGLLASDLAVGVKLEGPDFFVRYGWEPRNAQGLLKTAAKSNRPPAEVLPMLPVRKGPFGKYPKTGVCLLKKR